MQKNIAVAFNATIKSWQPHTLQSILMPNHSKLHKMNDFFAYYLIGLKRAIILELILDWLPFPLPCVLTSSLQVITSNHINTILKTITWKQSTIVYNTLFFHQLKNHRSSYLNKLQSDLIKNKVYFPRF